MTRSLTEAADAFEAAAATLAEARTGLAAAELGVATFGGDATGRPGAVGTRLHEVWSAALAARGAEAADMVGRLDEVAHGLRMTGRRYVEAEQAAHRRWPEERP